MVVSGGILPAWHPEPAGGTLSNAWVDFSRKMFSLLSSPESPLGDEQAAETIKRAVCLCERLKEARLYCINLFLYCWKESFSAPVDDAR